MMDDECGMEVVRSTHRRQATWLEFRMRFAALRLVELAADLEQAEGPDQVRAILLAIADAMARDSGTTLDAILAKEAPR